MPRLGCLASCRIDQHRFRGHPSSTKRNFGGACLVILGKQVLRIRRLGDQTELARVPRFLELKVQPWIA
jgi:hypothetical protein